MSDLDEMLSGETPEANETVQPVEAEQPQEAQAEPAEAEQAQEQPETPAEAPQEAEPTVPLAVFKSMRDDLKSQLDQIKTQIQQPPAQREPAPEFLDPEGAQYMQQQMAAVTNNMMATMSERFARMQHGDDAVNIALEAAQSTGAIDQFRGQDDPWGKLVAWHKTQQVAQEIGPDPAAYRQKLEAEIRQKIQAEMAAKQAQEMAAKSAPSLAGVNGTGGNASPGWQGPTDLNALIGE